MRPPNAPVLTMSSLGKLGRFGNQLMQYAFLRICAQRSGARTECPAWAGNALFGFNDPPIAAQLPPAIERSSESDNMFDALPELIPYIEKLTQRKSCRIGPDALEHGAENVDLWGFFQLHTRYLRPHKDYIHSLFQPVDELHRVLHCAWEKLQARGRTVVGIHIRQGDFAELPLFGFTFPVPASWWCDWLNGVWHRLDHPVLFICSDALDRVRPVFAKFHPVTSRDLNVALPETIRENEFYTDFHLLTRCDVLGISNSTFSFCAAMLNERAQRFIRPHWDFSTRFAEFDPWNSDQLLYYRPKGRKLFKSFREALHVAWNTEGMRGLTHCGIVYPRERIKMKWNRATYAYKASGLKSVLKSLTHPLPV